MASPRPGSTLGLLEQELSSHGERLRALAARAREGRDEELVHDLRVALRRVEALARLFRGVPGTGDGDEVREAARALRRRLSVIRSEEAGRALLARRPEADARLTALVFPVDLPAVPVDPGDVALVGRALSAWRQRLGTAFDGPFAPRADGEAGLLRKARRRLRRRLSQLSRLLPPGRETLHPARIAAKRVRYALEIVEPLDPGLRPVLRLLRAFQAAAGDAHDLVELTARVRALAGEARPSDPGIETLLQALEVDSGRTISTARRLGATLAGPVRRARLALSAPKTR